MAVAVGRTKQFVQNSLMTAILQAFTMLAGFVVPRVMLDFYGSEVNGLVMSVTQFIACFNLVEAGISAAATYSLYGPLTRRDIQAINSIIVAARNFYNKTGFIFVSLTIGFACLYPFIVVTDTLSPLDIGFLVLIMGVNGALEFFTLAKYRVLLTADQKTWVISFASIIAILLNVGLITGMAYAGFSVVMAKFVALFAIFARTALLYYYCRQHYSFMDFDEKPNNEALSRRWDALYLQILGVIHSSAPLMLATFLTDLKTVSVFAIYNLVAVGLQGILGIFTSGLAASFGDVIARKQVKVLQEAITEFEFIYNMLIVAVYSVAAVTIVPFVLVYTTGIHDAEYNDPLVGILLMLNGWLFNLKTPQGMLVISAGLYKETRWQTTVQGIIELGVGAILGIYWGIYGILAGMLLSNIYRDIELPFFITCMVTKLSPWATFCMEFYGVVAGLLITLPWLLRGGLIAYNFTDWIVSLSLLVMYAVGVVAMVSYLVDRQLCRKILVRFRAVKGE